MVDALESLKTYLNNDNCVFVVACDDNVVRSVINKSSKIPGSQTSETDKQEKDVERRAGEHYLDKFFQQTFRLPEYMGINLHDFAMENLRTTNIFDELTIQKVDVQNLVSIILPSDVGSPRKVKRLLNEFIALYEIVRRRENEKDGQLKKGTLSNNLEFLGKFSTLRAEYPSFYKTLISDTGLLARVTTLIQQNGDTARQELAQNDVENIQSLLAYLRKTQTIMVNDIDPYVWLSQDTLALGLKGNDYNQLRTALSDGNVEQVKGLLDDSDDTEYSIRLAKVASRLVAQRLVGIERQNGVRVMSHLLSQFDVSIRSEIANAMANSIPDYPVDVFSANEILNVIRWAYGIGIRTQKDKLIAQIISRLDNESLRQDTFSSILQNADVIDNNQGTSRVQHWLREILQTEKQTILKDSTDENAEDKNLANREFAEWLIAQVNTYSNGNLVIDNYFSLDLVDYAVFRLFGDEKLAGEYIDREGLGQNINDLFQILATRVNEGHEKSRFWDGVLMIIDGSDYYEDAKFAVSHVTDLISYVPIRMTEKLVIGSFLAVGTLSKKSDNEKVEDQLLVDILRHVLELTERLRERYGQEFSTVELEKLPECISELILIPSLQNEL
jgi:hypothetical protein